MSATLKELITETPVEDGKPLFSTAAELGEAIASQKSSDYTKARSVGTLIGFVFRGKRACPSALRDAILKAVRARLNKQVKRVQDDWVQRVGRAIDFLNAEVSEAQEQQSPPDEEQFSELIAQARKAKEQFIVTPFTAEEDEDMRQAAQLNRLLLDLLGICPPKTDEPSAGYCFLLPSEEKARHFWQNLKLKAEKACSESGADPSTVVPRLKHLEELNKLEVYVVPRYVCGCPIVVFDPISRFSTAFSFGYHAKNVIDAIQWDAAAISDWKLNVYTAFQRVQKQASVTADDDTTNFFHGYRYSYEQSQKP